MKELEELIQKAVARGIVPGAVARSPHGIEWTVGAISGWKMDLNLGMHDRGKAIYSAELDCWATVIAPTSKDQTQGPVDGMACEPDEHMRRAIVEKAKELGNNGPRQYYDRYLIWRNAGMLWQANKAPIDGNVISPGEFYDRLCRAKQEPPIFLFDQEVKFGKGYVQVGDQSVPNDTMRKIVERMLD